MEIRLMSCKFKYRYYYREGKVRLCKPACIIWLTIFTIIIKW